MNKVSLPALAGGLFAIVLLGGCTLAPPYQRPEPPVAGDWPAGEAYDKDKPGSPRAAQLEWPEFFADARLKNIIGQALENNRDLRLALLGVERAQGIYGIQRGEIYPSIDASGGLTKQRRSRDIYPKPQTRHVTQYSADLGLAGWEIDFFGRIRSLSEQALEEFLATDEGRRGAQIALIAQVARAYYTLAADRENLALAKSTLESQQAAYALIKKRFDVGVVSELDLKRAWIPVDTARAELARYTQLVAQDLNALNLLAGAPVPDAWLPADLDSAGPLREIAAGLPSEVLLNRPDVMAAEHRLKGAYASIGAARAALFPRIGLTASLGTASTSLSGLFEDGTGTWLFAPSFSLPIFDTRLWAAVRVSETDREIALTQYEKAIQSAFREVADALAVRGTIDEQLAAQESLTATVAETYRLAQKRYDSGIDSYLSVLDAQRTHFAAQQALVTLRYARLAAQIQLYAALGGGVEHEPENE
ncbi:MAG: efflux transporter outer membrane subunit [Candidatus Accumulibacter sp.]|jgi:multidrug efflux system outer membrane protein|nr:efflux transporter outer membrane subunit [Accumulibacter sp.]